MTFFIRRFICQLPRKTHPGALPLRFLNLRFGRTYKSSSMALNAASHNPTGEKTGPLTGLPPQLSSESTAALLGAEKQDPLGQHAGGQDGGDQKQEQKVKSEKDLEKERKKAEKAKKFAEKKVKTTNDSTSTVSKTKEKKAKQEASKDEALPEYIEETTPGEKKILKPLDDQFHKAYIPKVVESAWYDWWEKEGFFKPEFTSEGKVKDAGYFVIPIPPPNVTGALHIGHALANALQDLLIRWNRMKGKTTLFLPGCDHAGISTQSVVENMLWRRRKQTKHDLGRDKFTDLVWEWKEEYHAKVTKVLKKMGGSYDWSREAFTLDSNLSKAVTETFCILHEEGKIYRANKLVNWCVKLNTALSNLEVDNKEIEGRTLLDVPGYERKVEFGVLTFFQYEIEGSDERIEVATTRPETLLGDSAICVHPQDPRYKHLVGKNATHPFINRLMKIIADEYVDMSFGSGAVKITPAHDFNDYELGKKHGLEFVNILNDDGTLNHNTGKFQGMKRFDARYKVIEALKEKGLWVKWENNAMKVPQCSKSKDVIEPLMKPQWWMAMKDIAKEAIRVVENGEIKIRPESSEKSYYRWMYSINDWCLSRQLWWGHRIPAYSISLDGHRDENDNERWVTGRTEEEAFAKAKAKFKDVPDAQITLQRDPDVLDTWFSSGLWPMSTLGWPNETHDLEHLFPMSLLETGWDILFFWVARMIMFSTHLRRQIPFREVYAHGLIRDSEGRKMSKSLGNVIDPIDVMHGIKLEALHEKLQQGNLDPREVAQATKFQKTAFPMGIPECGADALRFSLINYSSGGTDINFDINVIYGYRRFCNKIYQATRFVLGNLESGWKPDSESSEISHQSLAKKSLAEKWILHKFSIACQSIEVALTNREFSKACDICYSYFYGDLCDVFIENSKAVIQRDSVKNTLYTALEGGLTMIHPFMPFITEELWQRLPRRQDDSTPSIVIAKYPTSNSSFEDFAAEEAYEFILDVSRGIRSLLSGYAIKDNGIIHVQTFNSSAHTTCTDELPSIRSLCGKAISNITILGPDDPKPTGCVVYAVSSAAAVFLSVKGRVDFDAEITKAQKKLERANETVKKQRTILDDEGYNSKVSEELQEVERKRLRDSEAEMREFEESIKMFERLKVE